MSESESKDASPPPPPSPKPSSSAPTDSDMSLRSAIKSAVDGTNAVLASLERTTHSTSSAVLSRVRSLERQARPLMAGALATYEDRGRYGPQIVGGSALVLGGLVALRRGKVPGALVGGAAGMMSYAGVYGVPIYKVYKNN